jgi:N-acetylneuraminate synthase/N,N'-diacetyllegionaminate synthase
MIDAAKSAGADAIKFQTYVTEELVTINAPKAEYQKKAFPAMSQFEMLKSLEFSGSDFGELFKYCKKRKILFLSTPFDSQSAKLLYGLGVVAFKISSGDLTNLPLLEQIAKYGKTIILSTGMSSLREVSTAVGAIYSTGNRDLILLHCTSSYPAGYNNVNLRAMLALREKFKVPVGYSDHTLGMEVALSAVALGATVIEKHFTLSNNFVGPDHKASIEPDYFKKMTIAIRNVEAALGSGSKKCQGSELKIRKIARKSIVAARDICRGQRLTLEMLAIKRPGTGIKPRHLNKLINSQTIKDIKKDQVLTWEKIKI